MGVGIDSFKGREDRREKARRMASVAPVAMATRWLAPEHPWLDREGGIRKGNGGLSIVQHGGRISALGKGLD